MRYDNQTVNYIIQYIRLLSSYYCHPLPPVLFAIQLIHMDTKNGTYQSIMASVRGDTVPNRNSASL